jgi:hypothetical protein
MGLFWEMNPVMSASKPLEAMWDRVDKDGPRGCWLWTGATSGRDYLTGGYGHFRSGGTLHKAHRVAWELLIGPIPEGMQLDHLCLVKRCVNPAHLRIVTGKENRENQYGARSDNHSSSYRGVSFRREIGKWRAQVQHHGRRYSSTHDTEMAAAEAAIELRRELFTHNDKDRP